MAVGLRTCRRIEWTCLRADLSNRPGTPEYRGVSFFYPEWFPNIVGMVLDDDVDWIEIGELLKVSYCVMAPKKLAALVA
jgi:hypothetical protein